MSESLRNDGRIWVPRKQGENRPADQIPEEERYYYLEEMYPSYGNLAPRDISSRAAKDMGPNLKNGPYGASKSAVNSLTATFSRELSPKIRVNAVAPGPIPTENFIDSMKMHTPEREAELKEYIKLPLERWGTPEDIGAAVLYMVSPASGWVTGQCLYVTGGS